MLRNKISPSPEFNIVKRVLPVEGTNLTLSPSPSTAAATARQKSASKPSQRPLASGAAKPAKPVVTTHLSSPAARTSSKVDACAAVAVMAVRATPVKTLLINFIVRSLLRALSFLVR